MPAGTEQPGADERDAIAYLRSPAAIRERAENVLAAGLRGSLSHSRVDLDRLEGVARRVVEVTRDAYPDLVIPYHSRWGHFRAGGVDRLARLEQRLAAVDVDVDVDVAERGRCLYDLAVTSVLLDAGAGDAWRYHERDTGQLFSRSEGLAVASFHMFASGGFSRDPGAPLRADAERLVRLTEADLAEHFQVSPDNPLAGLAGRVELLRRLGEAVAREGVHFAGAAPDRGAGAAPEPAREAGKSARVGYLFDHLRGRATAGALPARDVLGAVLRGLEPIWPGRTAIAGVNLGDVWPHPAAGGSGPGAGLVPFHKLSQWLTYSLIEPLEAAGVAVTGIDELTGLAEYRNGGLLVDAGVLVPRHPEVTGRAHAPGSEIIVEWRALTVALLDRVAERVRGLLCKSPGELPLVKVLEGGTWSAGRIAARERRPGGGPPIVIASDGTVF